MSRRRLYLLITIALGLILNPLNSSLISVAIVRIQHVFQLNFATASWIISSFYLSSAIAQPVMGKIADLFGHKRIFLFGLGIVTLSSILAPFSPSFGWLMLFRIIQSIGSSAIFPCGMAIVRNHIKDSQAKALAILSIFSNGTAALGPTLGGVLISWLDWHSIFLINIPIIFASFVMGIRLLPADDISAEQKSSINRSNLLRSLDLLGIVLFAISIIGILLLLLSLQTSPDIVSGAVGLLALFLFIWRELKAQTPFIPFRTFAENRSLLWVNLQCLCVNVVFYSIFFGMPTYLQGVLHLSEGITGLVMLCMGGTLLVAPWAGRWIGRSGIRPVLLFAGSLMVAPLLFMAVFRQALLIPSICLMLITLGVSYGLNYIGIQTALFKHTPKQIIGTASGLFMTSRYLGTVLSSLLLGLILGHNLTTEHFQILTMILAVFSIVVLYLSYLLPKEKTQLLLNKSSLNDQLT